MFQACERKEELKSDMKTWLFAKLRLIWLCWFRMVRFTCLLDTILGIPDSR